MAATGTPSELDEAIRSFRDTEAALDKLAHQAESLAAAHAVLTAAQASIKTLEAASSASLVQNAALAKQLVALAGDLAEATETVRRIDPAKIHDELARLSADFERHKERISEMTGETRARIEESTRSTAMTIETAAGETMSAVRQHSETFSAALATSDEAAAARAKSTERHLMVPAVIAALMSATAVILLVVELATT